MNGDWFHWVSENQGWLMPVLGLLSAVVGILRGLVGLTLAIRSARAFPAQFRPAISVHDGILLMGWRLGKTLFLIGASTLFVLVVATFFARIGDEVWSVASAVTLYLVAPGGLICLASTFGNHLINPPADNHIMRALTRDLRSADKAITRRTAAQVLKRFPKAEAVAALVTAMKKDTDIETRIAAAETLSQIASIPHNRIRDAVQVLGDVLSAKKEQMKLRQAAAEALGTIGAKATPVVTKIATVLVDALDNEDLSLRRSIIISLGAIAQVSHKDSPQVNSRLSDILTEYSKKAKTSMIRLNDLEREQSKPNVFDLGVGDVADITNFSMFPFRTEEERKQSRKKAEAREKYAAEAARNRNMMQVTCHAIGRVWHGKGVVSDQLIRTLVEALTGDDKEVQKAAAGALGRIGPDATASIPYLMKLHGDDDWHVRIAAVDALEGITGRRYWPSS